LSFNHRPAAPDASAIIAEVAVSLVHVLSTISNLDWNRTAVGHVEILMNGSNFAIFSFP
jgi:hypothetical protein